MFCGLAGHYRRFIKGSAKIAQPLYDVLGKEVKMGPVELPLEAQEAVNVKRKVQAVPVLIFLDFDKPFLLKTAASKEGLGPCSHRSKVMGITILSLSAATLSPCPRKITTAPSWSFWH